MQKKIAVMFAGQGSQSVGMIKDNLEKAPIIKNAFSAASSILDFDLVELVQKGPKEELDKTYNAQVAILTLSVALYKALKNKVPQLNPSFMLGHSLGEFSSLVCAKKLAFEDAVALVRKRGEFMQEATPLGTSKMAVILGLDEGKILDVCKKISADLNQIVEPVNFNSKLQIVIAGHTKAVENACVLAKQSGAKLTQELPVSVASHCELMSKAANHLENYLENIAFRNSDIEVIHNTNLEVYTDAKKIKQALKLQLYTPVLWYQSVEKLIENGVECFIECGAGKVLTNLVKRIDKKVEVITINSYADILNFKSNFSLNK